MDKKEGTCMRTVLTAPCFLDGEDINGNNRLERNKRYLSFYWQIRKELGFDEIVLFDNASDLSNCRDLIIFAHKNGIHMEFKRSKERLERGPGKNEYPYCWRALYNFADIIPKSSKIIWIDTDGFVLSKKMSEYIKNCESGWVSFLCETYNFPESSIFILNPDSYHVAIKYFDEMSWKSRVGRIMENDLPFTMVEKKFKCARFGEEGKPKQDETMDYYGQSSLDIELEFGKYK